MSSSLEEIEGVSQRSLPQHHFHEKVQLALIDGPHAYPFPDLEYYYLYPHLDSGALLILDDIQIRSIHNQFEFLRRARKRSPQSWHNKDVGLLICAKGVLSS